MYFLGHNIELTLVRDSQECTIVKTSILGESETMETFDFTAIHRAVLQESRKSDGNTTYRIALETDNGPVPLADYYSSGKKGYQKKIKLINDFIAGSEPELHIIQSGFAIRVVGFIFGGLGFFMLLAALGKFIRFVLLITIALVARATAKR